MDRYCECGISVATVFLIALFGFTWKISERIGKMESDIGNVKENATELKNHNERQIGELRQENRNLSTRLGRVEGQLAHLKPNIDAGESEHDT